MIHKHTNRPGAWAADRGSLAVLLANLGYWVATLLYLELVLHLMAFGAPDQYFGFVFGFTLAYAPVLALLTSLLPKKVHFWVTLALAAAVTLLFASQAVYYYVFGGLYSLAQVQQGGQAITSFFKETVVTIRNHFLPLLSLFVPLLALIPMGIWCRRAFAPSNWLWRVHGLVLALIALLATVCCLTADGTGSFSSYGFYHGTMTTTEQAARRFGLLTAFRLDLFQGPEEDASYYNPTPTEATDPTDPDPTAETLPPVEYNVLPIDFGALNAKTDQEKVLALNGYMASLTGTNKNEYTGMLKDYNLIVLCAESFSTGAIDQELTPTLYRLANEGFVFNNYYNTYPNNTSDGEYTLNMGLFPDFSRGKDISSFYSSSASYLPFCLGNILKEQRGIQGYGYHNYSKIYYGRMESHPNMGYLMKFSDQGMVFSTVWPSSDYEMMKQSVGDYITADEPFHAYYMTFSGHYAYDLDVNPMAARNYAQVVDAKLNYTNKCYLSCNIELEKAMAYLMQQLEEAGVAEKTAIVLTADHYPYGLTDKDYAELLGLKTVDAFDKAKSPLIFWVGGMEEPIEVDTYCSNVDILPTILNLWGLEYDSRLLVGTDIFSDGEHLAILRDSSFLTDKVWLNATTGEVRYLVPESEVPADYVENMIRLVQTKFSVSSDILNTGYYNFVFDKGPVKLPQEIWWDMLD